jgi:hypothetical protein
MKAAITGGIAALAMVAGMGVALAADDIKPSTTAVTVWVDGKGQGSMASKVSKSHEEMNAKGWRFADLDVYIEDGDMKGMFVTYVRDAATAP